MTYLDHVKCLTGQWRAGSNAGGQLANKTFHINPQIKIKSSDQRVKFQLMVDSKAPIGLMLFKLKGESVPVGIDWLYKHYRDAVRMTDGDDGPFIKGTSAPAVYSLEAGSYVCLLHMDQPDTERRFALVIRSQTPLYDIEPHQMEWNSKANLLVAFLWLLFYIETFYKYMSLVPNIMSFDLAVDFS